MADPVQFDIRGAPAQLFVWAQNALEHPDPKNNSGIPLEVLVDGPGGTGKSHGIAAFLLWCAANWQGARILCVRQTRASMTESVLVSFEDVWPMILPGMPFDGPSRESRTHLNIGRSIIVFGSMENTDRLYGTKWDIVWYDELREELKPTPWDKFRRGMRNFVMPFRMRLGSTNPDDPQHWLNQRCERGKMHRLLSRHTDNPHYWDERTESWTAEGHAYIEDMAQLTGILRKRLYEGVWCSAEGAIFDEYSPATHFVELERDAEGWVTRAALDRIDARAFYGGCDFGFTKPGALGIYAFCGDKRKVLICEVYHTKKDINWWAERLFEIHQHYRLELVFCDPSAPGGIATFNDRLGVPRNGPGAIAVEADNAIFRGLDIVRRNLSRADGGPKLYFDKRALYMGHDYELVMAEEPINTVGEFGGYVYQSTGSSDDIDQSKRKEKPDPRCADHGMDQNRYLCVGLEYNQPPKRRLESYPPKSLGHILGHHLVGKPKFSLDQNAPVSKEWDQPLGF